MKKKSHKNHSIVVERYDTIFGVEMRGKSKITQTMCSLCGASKMYSDSALVSGGCYTHCKSKGVSEDEILPDTD